MYVHDLDDPIAVHSGLPMSKLRPRPASGPIVSVAATRQRVPLAAQSPAQLAWNGSLSPSVDPIQPLKVKKSLIVGAPRVKVTTLLATSASANRKSRLQPTSIAPFPQRKLRVRSSTTNQQVSEESEGPVTIAASAATAGVSTNPSSRRPTTFFDPFELMYSSLAPDHVLSLPIKRFVVGKLTCKSPATVHFKNDRICYMFVHPQQPETQIMMELFYHTMVDVRTTPIGTVGAFSFKIPHHLPAFDGYGDYEPHLRNHRLTIEFLSQNDLANFKTRVYPYVQQHANMQKMNTR